MCWTVGGERLRGYKRRRWWTTVGWMCDWLLNKWMEQKSVLPWYCGPTLTLALCRKLKRNGFMTCEQRWKAVRMYKSLHPLWQLSLRHQMQADGLVKQGPPRSSYARVSRVLTVWSCCWQWLASSPGNRLHLSSGRDQHLTKKQPHVHEQGYWMDDIKQDIVCIDCRTFSIIVTRSCSVWPFNGRSPMNFITAVSKHCIRHCI